MLRDYLHTAQDLLEVSSFVDVYIFRDYLFSISIILMAVVVFL